MRSLFFLFFLLPFSLFALYEGNPIAPETPLEGIWIPEDAWWGVKVGDQIDWTGDRKLEMNLPGPSVDSFSMISNQGFVTFNWINRLEATVTLGALKAELCQRPISSQKIEITTHHDFVWSVRGDVILIYWKKTSLGVSGGYMRAYPGVKSLTLNGSPSATGNLCLDYKEWQIGTAVTHEIGIFSPYIGLNFARAFVDVSNLSLAAIPFRNETLTERNPFILAVGSGLSAPKGFAANFELRTIGEFAFSFVFALRF